eukprot:CAMPEP_0206052898 /NCGR_PEP_ID=MMETSP1466-20131121/34686_1 /ASSEMBLY_ACC=CAM_ASM_001126 /TAXON_ID=44452 /ORGANISM="Pavlova gyrans, Strain CCMP608" /LENGTH=137 /DNA_ID=CAMNT_0053428059 /DNA_START=76 /DNA_END=486 /DNA_ORIENTATION=-
MDRCAHSPFGFLPRWRTVMSHHERGTKPGHDDMLARAVHGLRLFQSRHVAAREACHWLAPGISPRLAPPCWDSGGAWYSGTSHGNVSVASSFSTRASVRAKTRPLMPSSLPVKLTRADSRDPMASCSSLQASMYAAR